MDSTDIKILNCLIENSRMNSSEISDKVKLSVSAVIERIKKLETNGVIQQYSVILDNTLLGKDVTALIDVTLDNPKYNESFETMVKGNNSIVECHYIAGDHDYTLKVVTVNTKSLERVLNDIKSVQGVTKTRTMIILSSVKNSYSTHLKTLKKI